MGFFKIDAFRPRFGSTARQILANSEFVRTAKKSVWRRPESRDCFSGGRGVRSLGTPKELSAVAGRCDVTTICHN
jgi:hypothetical protein